MGESPIAERNLHIARFTLTGITPAPKAAPEIVVTFEVDQECKVKASAVEEKSGLKALVESEDAKIHLSDDEIRQLLQQAEANRTEDQKLLKSLEARNRAEALIHRAEAHLRKRQELGLRSTQDDKIEQALATLGLALQEEDNPEDIRAKVEELEKVFQPLTDSGDFSDFFQSLFGTPMAKSKQSSDDYFSTIFGTSKATSKRTRGRATEAQPSPKDTMPKKTSPKETQLTNEPATRQRIGDQIGKIFGGGEFTPDPNLCFVLMPFAEVMRPVFDDHIRPVVESGGVSCLRADEIVGTNVITWDIWEKINRARFIIADLTGRNPNVFYEVGIAHALGKEVILLAQSMEDVPFDLKALRCIVYTYTPRGMRDMEKKLRATIREIMRSS
jgi:hypothetical protein